MTEPTNLFGGPHATPKLNAALARVQAALGRMEIKRDRTVHVVPKDKTKEPYSYSYATLASLTTLAYPLLGDNGLSFTCWPGASTDGKGLSMRYALRHESGEVLEGEWPMAGAENIQTLGGRLSFLRRYAFAAVLGLAADEDDDGMATMIADGEEPGGVAQRRAPARTARSNKPAPRSQAGPELPGGDPAANASEIPRPMMNHMFALIGEMLPEAKDRAARLAAVSTLVGRKVASSNELNRAEVQKVIDTLQAEKDATAEVNQVIDDTTAALGEPKEAE